MYRHNTYVRIYQIFSSTSTVVVVVVGEEETVLCLLLILRLFGSFDTIYCDFFTFSGD